mmetsp:Transcript_120325/g.334739  ORF Transcript_120325/g.334739 Transcript_120325/m.334739 type:complete len:206 (+) Transcript_120325:278-895(+)
MTSAYFEASFKGAKLRSTETSVTGARGRACPEEPARPCQCLGNRPPGQDLPDSSPRRCARSRKLQQPPHALALGRSVGCRHHWPSTRSSRSTSCCRISATCSRICSTSCSTGSSGSGAHQAWDACANVGRKRTPPTLPAKITKTWLYLCASSRMVCSVILFRGASEARQLCCMFSRSSRRSWKLTSMICSSARQALADSVSSIII